MGLERVCGRVHPYDTVEFDLVRKGIKSSDESNGLSSDLSTGFYLLRRRCNAIEEIIKQKPFDIRYFYETCYINVPTGDVARWRKPFISDAWTPDSAGLGRVAGLWFPRQRVVELLPYDDFQDGFAGVREENVFVTDIDLEREDRRCHNEFQWLRLKACVAYLVCRLDGQIKSAPLSIRTSRNILKIADKHHIDYKDVPNFCERQTQEKEFSKSLKY